MNLAAFLASPWPLPFKIKLVIAIFAVILVLFLVDLWGDKHRY